MLGIKRGKKETVEEKVGRRKKELIGYFNSKVGKRVFEVVIKVAEKGDKEACPLYEVCTSWFAKKHDSDFPVFFLNPCWEMDCLCPLRKDGCDNCQRKKENNPLC